MTMVDSLFLNEKSLKEVFGPESEVGDKKIYLRNDVRRVVQSDGTQIGKPSFLIDFFGDLPTRFDVTSKEQKNKITIKNYEIFIEKIQELLSMYSEINNIIFTGHEALIWQTIIAKIISFFKLNNNALHTNKTFDILTNGLTKIDDAESDWIRYSKLIVIIDKKGLQHKKFPLLGQLSHPQQKTYDHEKWEVVFTINHKREFELAQNIINGYNIPPNRVVLKSDKNQKLCILNCFEKGYNYTLDFDEYFQQKVKNENNND